MASNSSFNFIFSSAEANSIFCPRDVNILFKSRLLSASSALLLSPSICSVGWVRERIRDEGRRGRGTKRFVWLFGWFCVAMDASMCDSRSTSHCRRVWSKVLSPPTFWWEGPPWGEEWCMSWVSFSSSTWRTHWMTLLTSYVRCERIESWRRALGRESTKAPIEALNNSKD